MFIAYSENMDTFYLTNLIKCIHILVLVNRVVFFISNYYYIFVFKNKLLHQKQEKNS